MENKTNKKAEINVVLIIGLTIVGLVIIFFVFITVSLSKDDDFCKSKGYKSVASNQPPGIELGYISCCNDFYVDHILQTKCEVIKR